MSEKIPIGNGFGWDGVIYAELARNFYEETCVNQIDAYRVQRLLPSLIVHFGLQGLNLERTNTNIIHGFGALNVACLTLLAWCWCRIAKVMEFSTASKWLGFGGLFINFCVLKNTSYYPVLTDIPALAIGGAMVCCYLESRRTPLLILSALGAFTWPTLIGQGVLLALFPRDPGRDRLVESAPWRLNSIVAGLGSYYLVVALAKIIQMIPATVWTGITPIRSVILLSAAIAGFFVFQVSFRLLDRDWKLDVRRCFQLSFWTNAVIVLSMVFVVKGIQSKWATNPTLLVPQNYALLIGIWAIAKPGVFYLAHIVYYGPLMIVAMYLWKPMSLHIREYGLGITLMFLAGAFLTLDSESRHLIAFLPAVVTFVIKSAESLNWNARQTGFLAVISVLYSKCWLTMNVGPLSGNVLHWPDQRYLMNTGPYMSDATYLVQGVITIGITIAIGIICVRRPTANFTTSVDSERLKPAA